MHGMRGKTLEYLRERATALFAKQPECQSLMMSVAQYWNDEADGAVHAFLVASERRVPVWPHVCSETIWNDDNDPETVTSIDGERCQYCGDLGYLPFDDNGWAIGAFEAYCNETGSQEEPVAENYRPYAIARRQDDRIAVEIVGTMLRPANDLYTDLALPAPAPAQPFDARARELFELVCTHPADDEPRRVLGDYLLEREDPRGEYISLALTDALDAESTTRRSSLLEEHLWSWIQPLDKVVPIDCARFERGLLAHLDVFASSEEVASEVRGASAWASVESLRFLGDGFDVLDPVMRALREVGPMRSESLATLARGPAWSIEALHAVLVTPSDFDRLIDTHMLPKLRRLTITARDPIHTVEHLHRGIWWSQLESLTVLGSFDELRTVLGSTFDMPRLAIAECGLHGGPAGWCFTLDRRGSEPRLEVSLADYTPTSTRARLAEQLVLVPDLPITLVGSSRWQPTQDDVANLPRAGISLR